MLKLVKEKLVELTLTAVYTVVFYLGYILYMNHYFEYMGFLYYNKPIIWYFYAFFLCLFPIFVYSKGKISSFLSVILYLTLYIPIIIFYTFFPEQISSHHILVQLFCFLGMILFFLIGHLRFDKVKRFNFSILQADWIVYITVVLTLYTLFHFRSNLRLVDFDAIYELRDENKGLSSTGGMSYIILWLTYFFMPFSFVYGILVKNKITIYIGVLSALLIYMATGAKLAFFMPIMLYGLYLLLRNGRLKNLYFYVCGGLAFFMFIPIVLGYLYPENEILQWTNSILLVRTVGNGGNLTYWYDVFFQTHPHTYMSHVNIVNLVTHLYPYKLSLGEMVGKEFWSFEINANASFWATDGIGGFGIYGILILNILFASILLLLDYLSSGFSPLFIILLFLPFATVFLNVSIFTSMLSGGVVFTILFLLGKQTKTKLLI